MKAILASLFVVGLSLVGEAQAACQWEWVCNESGQCKNVPLCDSTLLDIPPPQPPSIAPIAPPSIRPIAPPTLPPLGTSNCTQVQKQDGYGNWHWETVCY